MQIDYTPQLTFNDVLLKPSYSDIINRESEVDIKTDFLGLNRFPIISANMDFVTGVDMAVAMEEFGAIGILNRFEDPKTQSDQLLASTLRVPIISVGIRDLSASMEVINRVSYAFAVCIDVAHGDHIKVTSLIKRIKDKYPRIKIIAGNVATGESYWRLADAGADAIKVGIGPGSVCTTREVTGIGVPQFSAIMDCAVEARVSRTHLIADGGINSSGDIVKALAAGAHSVMVGRLLAGHDECPVDFPYTLNSFEGYRPYRGQSLLGVNRSIYTAEGVFGWVPAKGPVKNTLKQLVGGIISGFSYVGARNIKELQDKAEFIVISPSSIQENGTRVKLEV